MAQKPPNREIPLQDIARSLEQGVAGADPLRASGLANLSTVRQVKSNSQQRELKRLQLKHGENHPRVQALEQKLAANQILVNTLVVEKNRAEIDFPVVDENSWVLHGYVFRQMPQERVPLPGVTVIIADQEGQPVKEVGFACTNKTGYFQLKYTRQKSKDPAKPKGEAAASRAEKTAGVEAADTVALTPQFIQTANAASDKSVFFAQVLDKKGTLLHSDDEPIDPQLGKIDYVEIVVGEPPCPSPFDRDEAPQDVGDWVVRGRVVRVSNAQERPLGGVMVSAFDADERFDDKLGSALTLKDGTFEIRYRQHDFARDSEKGTPDLYVTVSDGNGREIFSSRNNIRTNAKREEAYQIVIGG